MTTTTSWDSEYNSAKGSILAGNGTRPVNLPVGADGQVLTADSAQPTGLAWGTAPTEETWVGPTAFSPTLEFGGASTGITYVTQSGRFFQVIVPSGPDIVWFTVGLALSSKGTSIGNAAIILTGLPTVSFGSVSSSYMSNLTLAPSYTSLAALCSGAGARLNLNQQGSGQPLIAVTNSEFANTTVIEATGFYFV